MAHNGDGPEHAGRHASIQSTARRSCAPVATRALRARRRLKKQLDQQAHARDDTRRQTQPAPSAQR